VAEPARCPWARGALDIAYHDTEWGTPQRDERALFELLILEGAQAGLSWSTILKKRAAYRAAFAGFHWQDVAAFGPADEACLLADPGIVRNRLKIGAAIGNARALVAMHDRGETLADLVWGLVDGRPVQGAWHAMSEVPARTPLADRLSRELRGRGFRFVGPTICYAFMQAAGVVNDHLLACFRHAQLRRPDGGGA
jgi:DNA-3-methyladenine glycosylase I